VFCLWFPPLLLAFSGCGAPISETHPSVRRIASEIDQGDEAFDARTYPGAIIDYHRALDRLDDLERFERASPEPDGRVLQWCYNTRAVIQTKLRLANIGNEIDTLGGYFQTIPPTGETPAQQGAEPDREQAGELNRG